MLNMTAVGRIGRDVELRTTSGGDSVCNVVIGCNYGRKGEDGKQPTQWIEGTIWGKRAESLAEYLTKGKQVILVLSDIHIETYEGQNGQGHKLIGTVQDLAFGATPQGNGDQGGSNSGYGAPQRQQAPARGTQQRQQPQGRTQGQGQQRPAQQRAAAPSGFDDLDDDIPF